MALYKGDKLLAAGASGKSAYDAAIEGGYKGTEEEFYSFLATAEDKINDVNTSVSSAGFKIGDTLNTARTDVGDEWLLCNGELVKRNDYPELGEHYSNAFLEASTSGQVKMGKIKYYNGFWVGAGADNTSTKSSYILTADNPAKKIAVKKHADLREATDLTCYNGTWVVIGTSSSSPCIYTSTDPENTWELYTISDLTGVALKSIICLNGVWVIAATINNYPYIFTTTDLFGEWKVYQVSTDTKITLSGITYYNNTWIIFGNLSTGKYPYIFTATELDGSWSGFQLAETTTTLTGLIYYNNIWISIGYKGDYSYILTSTTLLENWTEKQISDEKVKIYGMNYYNGTLIAVGNNGHSSGGSGYIFESEDLGENWELKAKVSKAILYGVGCDDISFVAVGSRYTTSDSTYQTGIVTNSSFILPTISQDSTYTYIKAKEASDL